MVHPDKTRLVPFQRPSSKVVERPRSGGPGTFDLLGFTHYWGRSRRGFWAVKRKTARGRLSRAIMKVGDFLRRHAHWSVPEQHTILGQKLRGHYAYYGVTGNYACLAGFRSAVMWLWRKWLGRRNRLGPLAWPQFAKFLERFPLPRGRVVHSVCRPAANP